MSTRLPQDLEARLAAAASAGIEYTSQTDEHGVANAWCGLADQGDLRSIAEAIQKLGARLSMITCTQPAAPEEEEEEEEEEEAEEGAEAKAQEPKEVAKSFGGTLLDGTAYEIAYHFDVGGDTLTVIAYVPQSGTVPSLTSLFRTADWHEREMMELYSVIVSDHPDPRRLFLDASIDGAVLERLVPFSTLTNAASTKGLWDKILANQNGAA